MAAIIHEILFTKVSDESLVDYAAGIREKISSPAYADRFTVKDYWNSDNGNGVIIIYDNSFDKIDSMTKNYVKDIIFNLALLS